MILITGGTGTVGSELCRQLKKRRVGTRLLVRSEEKGRVLRDAGFEVTIADLSRSETLAPAFEGIETLFLLVGAGAEMGTLEHNAFHAAKVAGVERIVKVSAIGANPESPARLGRIHGEVEAALELSGIAWTSLQPHAFMQHTLGFAGTIASQGAFYSASENAKLGMIDARDIAEVATRCLTESGHDGKKYVLTGPESISYSDVANTLASTLGREVRYVSVPPEAAREGMTRAGVSEWLADALLELAEIFRAGHGDIVTGTVQEITGRPPRDFSTFVKDHASVFGPDMPAGS